MALSDNDQTRIREYLLGNLSEEDQQTIEERLMVEDDLYEELEISKVELIEEYRSGELAGKERSWFEQNYLATTEGRERHAFIAALECFQRPSPQPQRLTLFERLRSSLAAPRWAFAPV